MTVQTGELALCVASSGLAGLIFGWLFRNRAADSSAREAEVDRRTQIQQIESQFLAAEHHSLGELETERSASANLRTELDRVRREYATLEPQMQKLRVAMEAQSVEMGELLESKSDLHFSIESHTAQVATLASGIGDADVLRQGLRDRDERLAAFEDRYEIMLGEMHGEVGTLRARINELEPLVGEAGTAECRLLESQERHARIVKQKDLEIARLESELRRKT